MAYQSPMGMQMNNGSNNGGDGGQSSQPQGTEYTLQGVMRFLQTEWHRHERDRNAWEIERQEMKARIASLEGAGRRADVSQSTLKKYISMLQVTLKQERKRNLPEAEESSTEKSKTQDVASKSIKQRPAEKPHNSFLDVSENVEVDAEHMEAVPDKSNLLGYLTQCHGEFTYLMVAPSNPQPPPDPQASLAFDEDLRSIAQSQQGLEDIYLPSNILNNQREPPPPRPNPTTPNHQNAQQLPSTKLPIRNAEHQAPPMVRSVPEQSQSQLRDQDWRQQQHQQPQSFQTPAAPEVPDEESVTQINHSYDGYGQSVTTTIEVPEEKTGATEVDGWNFDDSSSFPEPELKPTPSRPDTDVFPVAQDPPTSPNRVLGSHRRKGSMSRRRSADKELSIGNAGPKVDGSFKIRFGLRGHLDAVRSVIFTGGGTPGEPEVCTAGDEGVIKRWIIPARYEGGGNMQSSIATDLDVPSYFTHRGHTGSVMCLAAYSPSAHLAGGGRPSGDGWVFSGGQDASVRVWERGRVDPKATLDGHTDAVWTVCVLPTTCGAIFGQNTAYGTPDRLLLASGSADGTVKVWSVSAPPTLMSPQTSGSGRRGGGRVRGNSMSAGTGFPSSPQPSVASTTPFHYTLIHTIQRNNSDASPTCITPLSPSGDNFVVSYSDAAVLVYDTRTGEEMAAMASLETYGGTPATGVNAIVATSTGLDGSLSHDSGRGLSEDDATVHGATGSSGGIEGTIISGHEDRYIRFYDANSGQCTYNMLAHPAAISSLSLSPDGQELVSAGHDASLRFWSLEKRSCTQEITSHRLMRGEGVCAVVWSQDGRFVVSGGGDGVVKVFAR